MGAEIAVEQPIDMRILLDMIFKAIQVQFTQGAPTFPQNKFGYFAFTPPPPFPHMYAPRSPLSQTCI